MTRSPPLHRSLHRLSGPLLVGANAWAETASSAPTQKGVLELGATVVASMKTATMLQTRSAARQ